MRIVLLIGLAIFSLEALAHARLKGNIPPRDNNAGIKTGPCGGIARTATPRVLQSGSTVTVEWEETINHPGRFEFYFSESGDTNFQLLATVVDTQNTATPPAHQFTTTITLPNVTCSACTLQMIQVMTENPASPSLYYSCADIQLTTAPAPPTPPNSGTGPVGPTPTEPCH